MPTQSEIINANFTYLNDKIKDIELFKFPNAIITGNPTIESGQVSNFSNADFLQFPFLVDLTNRRFRAEFCFTTGDDVTTQQNILDSEFGLALAIKNGKGLMAIGHNGTSWAGQVVGSINIQPRTTYYANLSWNRMNYQTQLSTNGTDYTADMNFGSTQSPYPRTMFIGGSPDLFGAGTAHPFKGSINLNKCFLYIEEQLVWQGMDDAGLATRADVSLDNLDAAGQAKFDAKQNKLTAGSAIDINNDTVAVELFDRNKFQVVGTPTITEDGIASGFSNGNSLRIDNIFDFSKPFKIKCKFKTGETLTEGSNVFGTLVDSNGSLIGGIWSNKIGLYYPSTNGSKLVLSSLSAMKNTHYEYEIIYDGSSFIAKTGESGTTLVTFINSSDFFGGSTIMSSSTFFSIGCSRLGNSGFWKGSIDLKQFSITVDGVEVFSGANTIYHFLNNKQDTLVSGTNIKTINNESILGEGNIEIKGGFDFEGTLAEYEEAQPTLPDDAKCLIIDDVGNIPTEITQEQLNDKADRDLSNCTRPYVVEQYDDGNGNGYRVWSNKFFEQWGMTSSTTTKTETVTFYKEFINIKYNVQVSHTSLYSSPLYAIHSDIQTRTTTGFTWYVENYSNSNVMYKNYYASGYVL